MALRIGTRSRRPFRRRSAEEKPQQDAAEVLEKAAEAFKAKAPRPAEAVTLAPGPPLSE